MRRLAPVGLALLGLALAVPAVVRAGLDPVPEGTTSTNGWFAKPRHLCARCQALEAQRLATGGSVALPGGPPVPGCAACAAMAGQGVVQGAPIMMGAEMPGVATLGGSRVVSTEPAPIDVVRTSYNHSAAMPGPTMMGATAGRAPMVPPAPTGWVPPPSPRPGILKHLFGLDGWGRRAEARAARAASAHAAMPLGNPASSPVGDLPASVVYGR